MPNLKLIANSATVDEGTWNAINVVEMAVQGWIFGVFVVDATTGEEFIYSEKSNRNPFPIDIPYGHAITVSANGENT